MTKSVVSESKEDNERREISGKRGEEDDDDEDEEVILEVPPAESLSISTVVSTVPVTTDQFMPTPEFRIHLVEFVHLQTLVALRVATKGWNAAADSLIDEGVKCGAMIVHHGNDISEDGADAREERPPLATHVIFLLNITKVGNYACYPAINLVIVDIPEGIERISNYAFCECSSLTTASSRGR